MKKLNIYIKNIYKFIVLKIWVNCTWIEFKFYFNVILSW